MAERAARMPSTVSGKPAKGRGTRTRKVVDFQVSFRTSTKVSLGLLRGLNRGFIGQLNRPICNKGDDLNKYGWEHIILIPALQTKIESGRRGWLVANLGCASPNPTRTQRSERIG